MNDVAIVIFGITGDLATRKLIPALYNLLKKERLNNIAIIGAAIDDATPAAILERAREHINDIDDKIWQQLRTSLYYQQLNFTQQDDYTKLAQLIKTAEKKHGLAGNRLFYLAAAAHFFCPITEHLGKGGVAVRSDSSAPQWHRIAYEKPFGKDLKSAHEINECIKQWFDESQIYRVDHYLTKELVSNISLLRFTNCVFEPLWNNRYIDQVQIVLSETVGIGNRGAYYDQYGALRDVVQNHMLELLALIGMEVPEKLTGDFVRAERAKVLQKITVVDGILGQYNTYTQESDVQPTSQTETFVALYLNVNNQRWAGVPFYLKTGKCLDKQETVIHIKFKQVDCLLAKSCPSESNWLTIKVAPDATFLLSLNAKRPGRTDQLMTVAMEFCHSCMFGAITPDAYEVLIEEVVHGEQATSVRFDEIEYAWHLIDAVRDKQFPLYRYKPAGTGPKELEAFGKKHGMRWRS